MSIISQELLTGNLRFAIRNVQTTLTVISPASVTATYSANKQGLEIAYSVMENGREQTIDTRFYIAADDTTTPPVKGFVLSDGVNEYKVVSINRDATQHTIRLDCEQRHQR